MTLLALSQEKNYFQVIFTVIVTITSLLGKTTTGIYALRAQLATEAVIVSSRAMRVVL